MSNLIPVNFQPNLYADDCIVSWASTTTLTVGAGQVRDSTNTFDIPVSAPLTISTAASGANGLDTGTIANNTWYAVFVIFDPTHQLLAATLLSTSETAPTMPSVRGVTYSAFRRVGWVKTDGSAHLLKFTSAGRSTNRFMQWDSPIAILSGGTQTTFTAVNASVGAPKKANPIYLNYVYTPTAAASVASIRPTGSTAASLSCVLELQENVDDKPVKENMVKILPQLSAGNASIDYLVTTGDALTLSVAAFDDYL